MNWQIINPVHWLDAAVTANVRYQMRMDSILVDRGIEGFRRLFRSLGGRCALIVALMTCNSDLFGHWGVPAWLDLAAAIGTGCVLGAWGAQVLARPLAYRTGWLKGRSDFVGEFKNHNNMEDMLAAQLTRDEWVLGLIRMPNSPEGLD